MFIYLSASKPPIPLGSFAAVALGFSVLLFLVLCLFAKPHIVADEVGVCINTRWRKRRFAWSQIREVEWRLFNQRTIGAEAIAPTYVSRVDPVLIGQDGQDLALINYTVWGRNETEQGTFIEFVGQHIKTA